jgi:hypothetical protein
MSTCLHQAYIDQMVVSNGAVFVINIKLSNVIHLELWPNCEFNNKDYKFNFETPIESPFTNVYKYDGLEKTALLSLEENVSLEENKKSKKYLKYNLYNNNIAKTKKLEGILFLENIFWCENTGENKNIQLEIYNKFQFLDEINGNFLTINSNYNIFIQKLNDNNSKGFYLLQFSVNDFVIYNNEFAVIINFYKNNNHSIYGNIDYLVFLSMMLKNSKELKLNNDIINYLKNTIKQDYNKFSKKQKKYFKENFSELNDYINNLFSGFLNFFKHII